MTAEKLHDAGQSPTAVPEALYRGQHLHVAMDMAKVGIWTWPAGDLHCVWNAQLYALTGRSPSLPPWSLKECSRAVHAADRGRMSRWIDAVVRLRLSDQATCELRVVRNDGLRWVALCARRAVIGGAAMIVGTAIDVTDRAQALDALGLATERVALAARSVGVGTWGWDVATDTGTWDEAMFRLRGLPVSGDAPPAAERLALVHPDDRPMLSADLALAASGEPTAGYEFRVVWPDGTVRWLASRSSRLDTDDGTLHYIGVNWDVTERRLAEQIRDEKFIAEQESRAKSDFVARMSHELRTPLNAVLGFVQLMQLDAEQGRRPRNDHLQHVRDASEYLLSLINEVLELSSLDSGLTAFDTQPMEWTEVVGDALPLVNDLAVSLNVAVRVGRLDGLVLADSTRMRQVLTQLLTTALKTSHAGGEVAIDSVSAGTDAEAVLRIRNAGLRLTVEQVDHLFDPFNRLSTGSEARQEAGVGVGLAVGAALMQRMGGALRARSSVDDGTVFEVVLPRASRASAASTAPLTALPKGAGAAAPARMHILYIEDNPVNVLLIEALVSTRGDLTFSSAATGGEGVAAAASLLPDLVLVDLHLPDIDGFEVLRRLRAAPDTAALRCVALSANAMADSIAQALAAGFSDYWTKPVNVPTFLATLGALFPVARH